MTQTNKEDNKIDMSVRADKRRFIVQLQAKLMLIAVLTIAGALAGILIYVGYVFITDGETKYVKSTEYYITFNEQEYPNGMDYYNAYTWNQFVKDDYIIDCVMSLVNDNMTKEEVKDSITSEMLGDYRLLTVKVTHVNPEYVDEINSALKVAMPQFAMYIPEILSIEEWSLDNMSEVKKYTKTNNVAVLGAIIAFVLACIGFSVYYGFDDRIFTQDDIKGFFGDITFIGYKAEMFEKEYEANLNKVTNGEKVETIIASSNLPPTSKSCVLEVPMGRIRVTQLRRRIDFLGTQECKICGITITECDNLFLKRYYK